MPLSSLREYLDKHNVKYIVVSHSVAYTAQGIAALTHIPGKELAKTVIVKSETVIVKSDGKPVMAVVPASFHVELRQLKKATGAQSVELASEEEFKGLFPECETGAMPPFGNLYGMDVYADETLAKDKEIAFNAGSHRELIRLAWEDFNRLAEPKVVQLVRERAGRAA
jgi:Ala-tRNA(Pro) deacylase